MLRKDNVVTYILLQKQGTDRCADVHIRITHTDKEYGYAFIPDLFIEQDGFEVGSEGYNALVSIFQAVVADDPQLEKDAMFVGTEWRRRPFLAIFFSRASLASRMRP